MIPDSSAKNAVPLFISPFISRKSGNQPRSVFSLIRVEFHHRDTEYTKVGIANSWLLGSSSSSLTLIHGLTPDEDLMSGFDAEVIGQLSIVATIVDHHVCVLAWFQRPNFMAAFQAIRSIDGYRADRFGDGELHLGYS